MLFILFGAAGGSFADVIIDNGGTGTSYTGTWSLSGATDPYGASSLWSRNGVTYTFSMSGQAAGPTRSSCGGRGIRRGLQASPLPSTTRAARRARPSTSSRTRVSGTALGTYYFDGNGSVTITAATGDTLSTCADAVKFTFVSGNTAPTAAIDSITPNPASPGESVTLTGHGTHTDGTIAAWE